MSWTNEVTLEFIDLYRREQLLWDPKLPEHRNRGEVSLAWNRIQSSLSINCSVTDLKKKKESLMTSFRFHLRRKKNTPNYRTTWFAYPSMEAFLGGKYECDSTNELENEFFNVTESYTHVTKSDPISCRNAIPEKSNMNVKQTRACSQRNVKISNNDFDFRNQTDETTDGKQSLDEYDLYGQLLAKKLRKLDEHQRDVAMNEIDNIMFRAKMQGGSQTRSYSTSSSPAPRKIKSPIFIVTRQNHTQYEDENISYQEHMQPQPPS